MKPTTFPLVAALAVSVSLGSLPVSGQETNPLFTDVKVKNYLPHMTWPEAEAALERTDVALIPVGSIEQHGRHLPLGTDSYAAIEVCKLIAQEADALVVPVVLAGISAHHMGFPGSLTLSPETFEAVVFETAQALVHHGIRKIAIFNGHGGNSASVANVITRINNSTSATAVDLGQLAVPQEESPFPEPEFDYHGGVGETSWMLFLTPSLVQMSEAENPVLTFPPPARDAMETMTQANQELVLGAYLFRPEATGKEAASHQISSNGVFTMGDLADSSAAQGKHRFDGLVKAASQFIEEWRGIR